MQAINEGKILEFELQKLKVEEFFVKSLLQQKNTSA